MATVKEIVAQRVAQFDFELESNELDSYLIESGVDGLQTYDSSTILEPKKALYAIIPVLLLQADVSEGQYSKKRNVEGIKAFYALICSELGLKDNLNKQPVIKAVNLW